jgi:hypothetical protein
MSIIDVISEGAQKRESSLFLCVFCSSFLFLMLQHFLEQHRFKKFAANILGGYFTLRMWRLLERIGSFGRTRVLSLIQSRKNMRFLLHSTAIAGGVVAALVYSEDVKPFVSAEAPKSVASLVSSSPYLTKDFIVDAAAIAAPSVVNISSMSSMGFIQMGSAGSGFIISKVKHHFFT